jgi:peptidoglycan/LPS O-acetylase OafA/YrhL
LKSVPRSAAGNDGLHIPSLDGIRAVAALIVFASHAGLGEYVAGGFGVTVFFFLSGYLITTLLRREYEQTGAINLGRFYLRRVFRIIPPLYIVLVLLLLPWGIPGEPAAPGPFAVPAQFAQLTNYYILLVSRHVIPDSVPTWSLAVEEHFYLLFPLLLLMLLRRSASYRRIAIVFGGLCVVELLWRLWLVFGLGVEVDYTFYATDTRLDSLLFGCIMGVALNPALDRQLLQLSDARWLGALLVAAALLAVSFLDRSEGFRATWRYSVQGLALMPIFFTAVRKSDWLLYRWLETRPMRYLGLISYTFYLAHLRMLDLVRHYLGGTLLLRALVAFLLTVTFASLMYYLVERHLGELRRRLHVPRAPLVGSAGILRASR